MKTSIIFFLLLLPVISFARPTTQVQVVRPTTQTTSVVRPTTQTVGTGRQTTLPTGESHPKTNVAVVRPITVSATSNKPTTQVTVTHPTTSVVVSRPTTVGNAPLTDKPSLGTSSSKPSATPQSGKKQAVSDIPSGSSATSMSGFKMPEAKKFQLLDASGGLGKPNEAEKAAAAAAAQAPKATNPSTINVADILRGGGNVSKNSLQKEIKNQSQGK